jgi:16S rRNA processing protein RimM
LPAPLVELAAVSGAHGITGEVRLKLFTESVDSIKAHKSFNAGALTLLSVRPHKGEALARFAEVTDRNGAEALRGTVLSVPREMLPPLADGEYYYSDLVGLPCVSTTGEALGHCISVQNFGAGDILEIERPDKKTFMVPMNADAVPEWDKAISIDVEFVV